MSKINDEFDSVVVREASLVVNPWAIALGPTLEIYGQGNNLNGKILEPFDIYNHAGNMGYGAVVAASVGLAAILLAKEPDDSVYDLRINEEKFSRVHRMAIGATVGITALLNCVTETKWGVSHLPIAKALGGTVADPLDLIYSVGYAGILSVFGWRKVRSSIL